LPIATAIISSGHEAFIKKTFAQWDLSLPDYLISDDDIRGRKYPTDMEKRFKPGLSPFALAYEQWRLDVGSDYSATDHANEARQHIMYFGDSDSSDRFMAERARVAFGHYRGPGNSLDSVNQHLNKYMNPENSFQN